MAILMSRTPVDPLLETALLDAMERDFLLALVRLESALVRHAVRSLVGSRGQPRPSQAIPPPPLSDFDALRAHEVEALEWAVALGMRQALGSLLDAVNAGRLDGRLPEPRGSGNLLLPVGGLATDLVGLAGDPVSALSACCALGQMVAPFSAWLSWRALRDDPSVPRVMEQWLATVRLGDTPRSCLPLRMLRRWILSCFDGSETP